MSRASIQLDRDQDEEGAPEATATRSKLWNWFGAAFGTTVLIGASVLYLTARTQPETEVAETVTQSTPSTLTRGAAAGEASVEAAPAVADTPPMQALLGLSMMNSFEVHELDGFYAAATEVDDIDALRVGALVAALDTVDWPEELMRFVEDLRAELDSLREALEAQDLEGVRQALRVVHDHEHQLSNGVYAWMSDMPMEPMAGHLEEANPPEENAPPPEVGESQVIEIEMFEFGYSPSTIDIQAGVPVVFRFTNTGRLPHEAMVGDAHMQEEFASAGDHDDGQEGDDHHGDLMATLVQPGETKDLEIQIDEPGTWYAACHLVGHYEAGQIATIDVRS